MDDVIEMTRIGLAQPYADRTRVAVVGGSHGGCVAMRALQRGLPAKLGVNLFGIADWANAYRLWESQISQGGDAGALYQSLVDVLRLATGGTPEEVPEEYAKRSPVTFAADLPQVKTLLNLHGALDELVPLTDTCRLLRGLENLQAYHVDADGNATDAQPAGCDIGDTAWLPEPKPKDTWPHDRYFLVYAGAGHGSLRPVGELPIHDLASFLFSRIY